MPRSSQLDSYMRFMLYANGFEHLADPVCSGSASGQRRTDLRLLVRPPPASQGALAQRGEPACSGSPSSRLRAAAEPLASRARRSGRPSCARRLRRAAEARCAAAAARLHPRSLRQWVLHRPRSSRRLRAGRRRSRLRRREQLRP